MQLFFLCHSQLLTPRRLITCSYLISVWPQVFLAFRPQWLRKKESRLVSWLAGVAIARGENEYPSVNTTHVFIRKLYQFFFFFFDWLEDVDGHAMWLNLLKYHISHGNLIELQIVSSLNKNWNWNSKYGIGRDYLK